MYDLYFITNNESIFLYIIHDNTFDLMHCYHNAADAMFNHNGITHNTEKFIIEEKQYKKMQKYFFAKLASKKWPSEKINGRNVRYGKVKDVIN